MIWVVAAAYADDPDALLRRARAAESAGDPAAAVVACEELVARWPDEPRAATCARRLAILARRRDADGSLRAWTELEDVRLRRAELGDAARARVEALWAAPGTPEVVRAEAAAWLAREELAADPAQVLVHTDPWRDRDVPDEPELTRRLRQLAAEALATLGRDDEARALQERVRVAVGPTSGRATPVDAILRDRRQRQGAWAAGASVAAFLALAAPGIRELKGLSPWGLAPLSLATLGAAALCWAWSWRVAVAVLASGPALAAVHALAAGGLRRATGARRGALRIAAGAASAGVLYGALWAAGELAWLGW